MVNMYLQILLRLNLIVLFLLLIRKVIGKRLRKKFVYGLWIVVPVFLLSFPFVRLPRFFQWEMSMGDLFHAEEKGVEPQDVNEDIDLWNESDISGTRGKMDGESMIRNSEIELSDPTRMEDLNRDELLTQKDALDGNDGLDQNEIPNRKDGLEQNENPAINGISPKNAVTVNTQASSDISTTTPAKETKLSTVVGVVYSGIVGILMIYMIISNALFLNFCKKKRIFHCKSEGVGLSVYHLDGIVSPFLMGKTIYLPSCMAEEEQIRYAILHEESHYLHGDAFWVIVRYIVLAVYFYDPVIWMAFFASGRDCELACDEAVLEKIGAEEGSAYGACLLESVEQKLHKTRRMVMTTNMSNGKKFMKERIVNIANRKKKSRILMAVAAAFMLVVVGCAFEKKDLDTSKQENLTSRIEETESIRESQEESVETPIEVRNNDEDIRVTESDEAADNIGESNNASENDFTLPDFESHLIEDYQIDYELFSIFMDNEKPDVVNFKDFKYDLDSDGEIDTITLKNQQYGSHDFTLFLNGEEFYQFPDGGVGVYIVDLLANDSTCQVAACNEDPSGEGLNYTIFRKQGNEMIYSGELKSMYFTQPDTDLYTIQDDALEYQATWDWYLSYRDGQDFEDFEENCKEFKYDLDWDWDHKEETITLKKRQDGSRDFSLFFNDEEFYQFSNGGVGVYIMDTVGRTVVAACNEDPSGYGLNYTIFRKQGEEMIYSGELKNRYFKQSDTDGDTIEDEPLEYESVKENNAPAYYIENCKDFKYDLDGDGEIDIISFKHRDYIPSKNSLEEETKLFLNGEECYEFRICPEIVYIIELNKEDGSLGVVTYDEGYSGDPYYLIFRKQDEEMVPIMGAMEETGCMFDKMGRIYGECEPCLDPQLCNVCYELKQDTVKVYRSDLKEVENVWYTNRSGAFVNELDYFPEILSFPENTEFRVLEKGYYRCGGFMGYKVQFRDGKIGYIANWDCWGD